MQEIFCYFNLKKPNTCLFRTQQLVPRRFGLDRFQTCLWIFILLRNPNILSSYLHLHIHYFIIYKAWTYDLCFQCLVSIFILFFGKNKLYIFVDRLFYLLHVSLYTSTFQNACLECSRCRFDLILVKPKTTIDICCFSAKHTSLMSNIKN